MPIVGGMVKVSATKIDRISPMNTLNTEHNRVCWIDIPVADLNRSIDFYSATLAVAVSKESMGDIELGVLEHAEGNGGCLVIAPEQISAEQGVLVYFNVNGRIRDAVAKAESNGGSIVEPIHSIGPHGFRAIILDSEGNRCALHSESDA